MIDDDIKKTIFGDVYMMINKIKKCNSKTMYNIYLYELEALYCLCGMLKIDDYPKLENYSNKSFIIDETKCYNEYYNQLMKDKNYHLEFAKNLENVDYYKYQDNQNFKIKIDINIEDSIYLMCEFLKKYDIRIYDLFKTLLFQNRIIINNQEETEYKFNEIKTPAYTISSYGSYLPYIVVDPNNFLSDSIDIVHELAHVFDYQFKRSNKIYNQKKFNCLDEVVSYYLQFVYTDYLNNENIFKQDIKNISMCYNYPFIEYVTKIEEEYDKLNIKDICDSDLDECLNYAYGIAIAYHFLDRYKSNAEQTKKEMYDFITLNGKYNMMEMLEKFKLKEELKNSKILKKYL